MDIAAIKVMSAYAARAQPRLKYCTALSWASAACLVENVPRLRRLPVFAFFLREYKRYLPSFILRIIISPLRLIDYWLRFRVRLALTAALLRATEPLLRAAVLACFASEAGDAAEWPSFLRAPVVARERFADGLRREWLCPWR